jgi:V/A-type H+-transporting ATPase subunit C
MADDTRYAYAVARVRGMETRLLDRQWIERLLSETPAGVLKALGDSAYQDALAGVARPEDVEQGLEKALAETLQTIARVSPEPELIDLFRLRWDVRNLKSLIKASVLKMVDVAFGLAPGVGHDFLYCRVVKKSRRCRPVLFILFHGIFSFKI